MSIDLTVARPKLNTTNNVQFSISPASATFEGNKVFLKVHVDALTPNPVTFTSNFTEDSNIVTLTNNTGKNISESIRVGDVVSGAESPFQVGAYVTNISVTGLNVTLTISDTAAITGSETLTYSGGEIDSTLYILEVEHTASGSNVLLRPALYMFDGTKVKDANRDGDDDLTVADATTKANLAVQSINMDNYLQNARLLRTNS